MLFNLMDYTFGNPFLVNYSKDKLNGYLEVVEVLEDILGFLLLFVFLIS